MCICQQKQEAARLAEGSLEQKARGAFLLDELRRAERLASPEYARCVLTEMRQLLADQNALDARVLSLVRELEAQKRTLSALPTELL